MRRVRSRDTSPEIALRKALWACGLRYRLQGAALPGKPDIVFRKARLAVFVDGDFWHGNQWRMRGHTSLEAQFVGSPRAEYWVPKIDRNMRRDRLNTAKLLSDGWRVLRFWESDLKSRLDQCVETVLRVIQDGVEATPIARLPFQTAAVLGGDFTGIGAGLESAGWSVRYARDHSDQNKLADPSGDLSLVVASIPDSALAQYLDSLTESIRGQCLASPPMLLFELTSALLDSPSEALLRHFIEALNDLSYSCDLFLLDEHKLFVVGILDARETDDPVISIVRPRPVIDFISRNPVLKWVLRSLPTPPPFDESEESTQRAAYGWIAEVYLNPAVTAAIHGKPLSLPARSISI